MNEIEIKANAMLSELTEQRNILGNRCAQLAAELAVANARIVELTPKPQETALTE